MKKLFGFLSILSILVVSCKKEETTPISENNFGTWEVSKIVILNSNGEDVTDTYDTSDELTNLKSKYQVKEGLVINWGFQKPSNTYLRCNGNQLEGYIEEGLSLPYDGEKVSDSEIRVDITGTTLYSISIKNEDVFWVHVVKK